MYRMNSLTLYVFFCIFCCLSVFEFASVSIHGECNVFNSYFSVTDGGSIGILSAAD